MNQVKGNEPAHPKLHVVLNGFFVVVFNIIGEIVDRNIIVINILHDLNEGSMVVRREKWEGEKTPTRFLKSLSSRFVRESALPMTGITLTRGERRFMSSMSISRSLEVDDGSNSC